MPTTDQAGRVTAPAPRRRGPASTENGQRSRDRVLQAAVELITEAGIDRVRVAEIARRAGMSSGQVMYYFTSKEHILLEALAWQDYQEIKRARAALAKIPAPGASSNGTSASTCPPVLRTRPGSSGSRHGPARPTVGR